MSWKSGVRVAIDVWKSLKPLIPEKCRVGAANRLLDVFQNHGCDSLCMDALEPTESVAIVEGEQSMPYTADLLWKAIEDLRRVDAIHVKRGYRILDIAPPMQAAHLCEESSELLQEVLTSNPDRAAMADEASHVLSVLVHLLIRLDIPLEEVCSRAVQGLARNWTTDESKVRCEKPGFTRTHRGELDPDDQ
jgi:NTP pyrophosphatase (non-canonical NTP hydrolase)